MESKQTHSSDTITVEEAQAEIRIAVKDAYFGRKPRQALEKKVRSIIERAERAIKIVALKKVARLSLWNFYLRQKQIMARLSLARLLVFLALMRLNPATKENGKINKYVQYMSKNEALDILRRNLPRDEYTRIRNIGEAMNMYHRDYTRRFVLPILDRMEQDEALDPESQHYAGQRNSLRIRAEREARYQGHLDEIARMRANGVKLVIVSAHADCSDRCRPWQGRVYSLDGTSGTTPDGRDYIPLEVATNILTPNGKWYNGLFGFNCRHYMRPYESGFHFPKVSPEREKAEYAITQRQRALERNVRRWRARAEMYNSINPTEFERARAKAEKWNEEYIAFSKKHDRAYYPDRTRLI